MFNVKKAVVKAEAGAVMFLKDEHGSAARTESGEQAWIKLAGMNSKRWRQAVDDVGDRRLKRAKREGTTQAKDMSEQRNDQCSTFAAVTLDWFGIGTEDAEGKLVPLACTPENAKQLYSEFPYVFQQVDDFLSDQTNF